MFEKRVICNYFGDVRVLNEVNLHLEKSFVYSLKGGNGSGKTKLIIIISGFLNKPYTDRVTLNDKVVKFDHFNIQAGLPSFVLNTIEWIEKYDSTRRIRTWEVNVDNDVMAYIFLILFLRARPLGFSGKRLKKIEI